EVEMEMLAEKNENIRKAYKVLKEASMDEQKRMAYESRQMALMDERTKITEALEEGIELGSDKRNLENAKRMHEEGIEIQLISKITEIPIEILKEKFSK
ncbi:MAG: transposase, partial [Clostridiales bacterium]